jgi:hypothetical protein
MIGQPGSCCIDSTDTLDATKKSNHHSTGLGGVIGMWQAWWGGLQLLRGWRHWPVPCCMTALRHSCTHVSPLLPVCQGSRLWCPVPAPFVSSGVAFVRSFVWTACRERQGQSKCMLNCTAAPVVQHLHASPWLRCKFVLLHACAPVCILPAASISARTMFFALCHLAPWPRPQDHVFMYMPVLCAGCRHIRRLASPWVRPGVSVPAACQPATSSVRESVMITVYAQGAYPKLHRSMYPERGGGCRHGCTACPITWWWDVLMAVVLVAFGVATCWTSMQGSPNRVDQHNRYLTRLRSTDS